MQRSGPSQALSTLPGWPYLRSPSATLLPLMPPPQPPSPTSFYHPPHLPLPPPSVHPPHPSHSSAAPKRTAVPHSTQTIALTFLHHRHQHTALDSINAAHSLTLLASFPCLAFDAEDAQRLVEEEADWVRMFDLSRALDDEEADEEDEGHFGELHTEAPARDEEEENSAEAMDADYTARSARSEGTGRERRQPRRSARKPRGRSRGGKRASPTLSASSSASSSAPSPGSTMSAAIDVEVALPSSFCPSSSASSPGTPSTSRCEGRRMFINQEVQRRAERQREESAAMLDGDPSGEEDVFRFSPADSSTPSNGASGFSLHRSEASDGDSEESKVKQRNGGRAKKRRGRRVRHPHQRSDRFPPLPLSQVKPSASSARTRRASSRRRRRRSPSHSAQHSGGDEGDSEASLTRPAKRAAKPPQLPPAAVLAPASHLRGSSEDVEASPTASVRGSHPVRILFQSGTRYRVEWSEPEGAPELTWERCRSFERWAHHQPIVEWWKKGGGGT